MRQRRRQKGKPTPPSPPQTPPKAIPPSAVVPTQKKEIDPDVRRGLRRLKLYAIETAVGLGKFFLLLAAGTVTVFILHYLGVFLRWALSLPSWSQRFEYECIGVFFALVILMTLISYARSANKADTEEKQEASAITEDVSKGESEQNEHAEQTDGPPR